MRKARSDAKRALVFQITDQDVVDAKRHDKSQCVVARAVGALPGIIGIQVGASIVQVQTAEGIKRYATPLKLKKALTKFDATGFWKLPAGVYVLQPPPPSMTREAIAEAHRVSKSRLTRHIDPKTGERYERTGRLSKHKRTVNPRVLEFAKIKKAARAARIAA